MKIDEVNFQQVGNSVSAELMGSCHNKKKLSESETVLPLKLNSWDPATIKNQIKLETVLPLNSWASAMITNQSK
jgi:hypothetical protein